MATRLNARQSIANRPVACLRCRGSRVYCSKEKPKCQTCRKGEHDCLYTDGRRISVLASYVGSLEAELAEYKARFATDSNDDLPSLNSGLTNLVITPQGTPRYLGVSSPTVPLGQLSIVGQLDVNTEYPTYNEDALRRRPITNIALPPYSVAKSYFTEQYQMIGTIFAFVSEEEFEQHLQEAYLGPPDINDQEGCLKYCQVLMIMAFGQMYFINGYYNADGPPGFHFFTQALQYLPGIHTEPSVLFCGILCLIGYYFQNLIRRDAAFIYLGLAQRMALTLGLHEEVSVPGFDEDLKEHRRRTWWSIYSLDRIFCIKYGNPVTMHDEDISVALPQALPHEPDYCSAVVLRHYTILSRILSDIMNRIYKKTPKTGMHLMTAVQDIRRSLFKWERELPAELKMQPDVQSRESISTYLHYYQCISMTARPLLFWVVDKRLREDTTTDWREGLPKATVGVVDMCIDAAKRTIALAKTAFEKNMLSVYGYMDGEHTFCATLVMVLVNIALSNDTSNPAYMDAGLALMQAVALKGNHHIDNRLQMLLQLLERARTGGEDPPEDCLDLLSRAMPVTMEDALDHVFTTEATTDLDLLNFKAAYSGIDTNIETEVQHMSSFPMNFQWSDLANGPEEGIAESPTDNGDG